MCNDQGHKANLFPLIDETKRGNHTSRSILGEQPLILNPFDTDPEDHIRWNKDIPCPSNGSPFGSATIDAFALDRDTKLIDARRVVLRDIKLFIDALKRGNLSSKLRRKYIKRLRFSITKKAPYSAMVKASFGPQILNLRD